VVDIIAATSVKTAFDSAAGTTHGKAAVEEKKVGLQREGQKQKEKELSRSGW